MSHAIQKCTAAAARAGLDREAGSQLVDVREFSEYESERIRGTTLVPLSTLEQNLALIDRDRPVYLVCRSGKRATQAAERLAGQGFIDLRVIEGGLQGWVRAGLPIERGTGRVWSLERQVRFVAGLFVLTGILLTLISPWFVLLSAFVGAGLTFSAITDTCGMGMMLARMPWNQKPKTRSDATCVSQ